MVIDIQSEQTYSTSARIGGFAGPDASRLIRREPLGSQGDVALRSGKRRSGDRVLPGLPA
jgi:hypothetical protein